MFRVSLGFTSGCQRVFWYVNSGVRGAESGLWEPDQEPASKGCARAKTKVLGVV